jgi:hypothetical protein
MFLVETLPGEREADLRTALDAMLASTQKPPRGGWWYPYELRGSYKCRGIVFREFFCVAGSVSVWLWMASRKGHTRRMIVLPGPSASVARVEMVGGGVEIPIEPSEVVGIADSA